MKRLLRKSHKSYLVVMLITALPLAILISANALILWRAGEFDRVVKVAAWLEQEDGIYGTGIHDMRKTLPLNLIKIRKPEIIAFGSSRPLDFRQEYFTQTFSCACQAMSLIDDGPAYAQTLLDIHTPKVVLFSLDFWWFQEDKKTFPEPIRYTEGPHMDFKKIMKPLSLIWNGKLSLGEYYRLLTGENDLSGLGQVQKKGLLALQRDMGIRKDGSLFSGVRLTKAAREYYAPYAQIIEDPGHYVAESDRYGPNIALVDERFETLQKIIDLFHSKGVKVVLIFPPIAPAIYDAMDMQKSHKRFRILSEKLKSYEDEFYDFHNPHKIGTNKCEFADQHHAGDTAYMRILKKILEENPKTVLKGFIDEKRLSAYIDAFSGETIADFQGLFKQHREYDFLNLGCNKVK